MQGAVSLFAEAKERLFLVNSLRATFSKVKELPSPTTNDRLIAI